MYHSNMNNNIIKQAMNMAIKDMNKLAQGVAYSPADIEIAEQIKVMHENKYYPNDPVAFKQLARFLAVRSNGRLRKGLLLIGNTGIGKTIFIKKFIKCELYPITDLVQLWKKSNGKEVIEIICPYWKKPICIDDIGTESTKLNNFGTKVSIVSEIISARYSYLENLDVRDRRPTYITTNLSLKEIEERYGDRVCSRIRQMCSVLEIKGKDMRLL